MSARNRKPGVVLPFARSTESPEQIAYNNARIVINGLEGANDPVLLPPKPEDAARALRLVNDARAAMVAYANYIDPSEHLLMAEIHETMRRSRRLLSWLEPLALSLACPVVSLDCYRHHRRYPGKRRVGEPEDKHARALRRATLSPDGVRRRIEAARRGATP